MVIRTVERKKLIISWLKDELGYTDASTHRYAMYEMIISYIRNTKPQEEEKHDDQHGEDGSAG
jgi:hypothetical protein